MGALFKTTKGKIITLICGVGVIAVGVTIALFLLKGEESYRTISVEEVNGTSIVVNDRNKSKEAYQGMHLYSGDDVTVQQQSDMTLLLDMDKYVYAEENTHFRLEATGDSLKSNTVIHLDTGAVLNRIENKLEEGSAYQVDTPNSTMSIRGTVFRVVVFVGEDGLTYTLLEVYEGVVQADLKDLQGNYNGVTETFYEGEAAWIRADQDFSEFIVSEGESVVQQIQYKELPMGTVNELLDYIEEGEELCIGKDLLKDYTGLEEHKWEKKTIREATCSLEGEEGLVCSVCQETSEITTIPKLSHTEGDWDTVVEATCEEPGSQNKVCTVCGEILETKEIEALGHIMGEWKVTKEATCEIAGSRSRSCTVCGGGTETRAIAALGHTMGEWSVTKEATCDSAGSESRSCTVCGGGTETREIGPTGHSMGDWAVINLATCVATGSESRSCTVCGATETQEIAATGHTMGAWTIDIPADCVNSGTKSRSCTVCGAKETQTIEATGHNFVLSSHGVGILNDDQKTGTVDVYYTCSNANCQLTKKETHAFTFDMVTGIATCECGVEIKAEQ